MGTSPDDASSSGGTRTDRRVKPATAQTAARAANAGHLALDNQICFLFHRISRDLTAVYRPLLADLGLTYPQYLVMLVLWEADGVGVGEIGRSLCLDSGTLSPLLRRLESAGLVVRRRESTDERRVTIHLTEQGRALRERAARVPSALAGAVADDPQDLRELLVQLRSLAARIESHQVVATTAAV